MNSTHVDPQLMNGTPCFTGTRVPVKNLLELLAADRSLDSFLEQFPRVTRGQTFEVIQRKEDIDGQS